MNVSHTSVFEFLCTVLRGDAAAWPGDRGDAFTRQFEETAARHGVHSLAGHLLAADRVNRTLPDGLHAALARRRRLEAMLELRRKTEIMRILDRLAAEGVRVVLLKGTPLAYLYYEQPFLRSRGDTDVFIRTTDKDAVDAVFQQCGYRQPNAVSGEWVSRQASYFMLDRMRIQHTFDVHWAINNSPIFAPILTFDDCHGAAIAVPALGDHARTLSPNHALTLACMHRAGHMHAPYWTNGDPFIDGNRLIWLYDIQLLLKRMSRDDIHAFGCFAKRKRLRAICRDALSVTRDCFGTPIPAQLFDLLEPDHAPEPSACYLHSSSAGIMAAEFRSIPGARHKLRYLLELAFPPPRYLLRKYDKTHAAWLPFLYCRRSATGLGKVVSRFLSKRTTAL